MGTKIEKDQAKCFLDLCFKNFMWTNVTTIREYFKNKKNHFYSLFIKLDRGTPEFWLFYQSYFDKCHNALARNLEQAGRYEDAAEVLERVFEDHDSARKLREKGKTV
jgi:hypothetical protein